MEKKIDPQKWYIATPGPGGWTVRAELGEFADPQAARAGIAQLEPGSDAKVYPGSHIITSALPVNGAKRPRTGYPITPHKGGRTADFPRTRLTPEARAQLDEILEHAGQSAADWITALIEREHAALHTTADAQPQEDTAQ